MATAIYLPEARDDIDAAYTYYETLRVGLGERFLAALARTVGFIEWMPQGYGEVADGIRAAVLRRFP